MSQPLQSQCEHQRKRKYSKWTVKLALTEHAENRLCENYVSVKTVLKIAVHI